MQAQQRQMHLKRNSEEINNIIRNKKFYLKHQLELPKYSNVDDKDLNRFELKQNLANTIGSFELQSQYLSSPIKQ